MHCTVSNAGCLKKMAAQPSVPNVLLLGMPQSTWSRLANWPSCMYVLSPFATASCIVCADCRSLHMAHTAHRHYIYCFLQVAAWLHKARAADIMMVDVGPGTSPRWSIVASGLSGPHAHACAEAIRYQVSMHCGGLSMHFCAFCVCGSICLADMSEYGFRLHASVFGRQGVVGQHVCCMRLHPPAGKGKATALGLMSQPICVPRS